MKVVNLGATNSVLNTFMAELRDKQFQQNRTLFRRNLTRIGQVLAYELSKTLSYSDTVVEHLSLKRPSVPMTTIS